MATGLFVSDRDAFDEVYGEECRALAAQRLDLVAGPMTAGELAERPEVLRDVEILLSSWGAPRLDVGFLAAAPKLRGFFYGAGSVRGLVTEEFWARDIVLTSAYAINAVPVAEYTLATILFSLKHGWRFLLTARAQGHHLPPTGIPGAYRTTVGLVSLGTIGRLVCQRLRHHDLKVIAYDPFVSAAEARSLGATLVSLDDLFSLADIVSLHTPLLKETLGFIRGRHFSAMKPGATFINTARGKLVCEEDLIRVLQRRPDLHAVLDVTVEEPPPRGSPLYSLPNVVMTPHIAGSMGGERRRIGLHMIDELDRYLTGRSLRGRIIREQLEIMA